MTTSATPPAARRGPGRPADGGDRRQAILDAARQQFAEKGFAAASVRAIARQADVDPALVHHYFGSKEQVFVAAMELPFDPAERLPQVLAGDPDLLGERLVRSAFTSEQGATMLREFVGSALLGRIVAAGDAPDPLRVQAAAAQLVGLVLLRHVVRLEPLASADDETLVALVAPTVQHYLRG